MAQRDRLLRDALRNRFIVTLAGGETFDGLLEDVDENTATMVDVWAVDASGRTQVDGRLYLPRMDIAYMQAATP